MDINVRFSNASDITKADLDAAIAPVLAAVQALGDKMSAEIDAVEAALATLTADASNNGAALDALKTANAALQAQLDAANAANTANQAEITLDKAELQKVTDTLKQVHDTLTAQGGTDTQPPVTGS